MSERRALLLGLLCLAGAGLLSLVCQALTAGLSKPVAGGTAHVIPLLLAATSVALLIHGMEMVLRHRRARLRKEAAGRRDMLPREQDVARPDAAGAGGTSGRAHMG